MSEEEKIKGIQIIKDLEKIMPNYDIFIMFGTLLGAVREGKIIDNDSDVDVCYLSHYHTAEEVEKEMIDIYKILINNGVLIKYFTQKRKNMWWEGITNLQKEIKNPFGQAHILMNDICIDLFTSWIDENGDFFTCQWGNFGKADLFFPLTTATLYDIEVRMPNNADKILERLYGDWRTPRDEKSHLIRKSYLKEWKNER